MSRQLLLTLGAAVILVGIALYSTVSVNQNHLLTLEGKITNLHVEKLNETSTLVLLDFTATNPSEVPFDIKQVTVERTTNTDAIKGDVLSKAETGGYVEYAKLTTNPPLGAGNVIKAGQTAKGLVAARFDVPGVLTTSHYRISFTDYNGVTAKIEGTQPPTE